MKRTIILLSFLLAVSLSIVAQAPTLIVHDHDIQLRATSRFNVASPQQGMVVFDTGTKSLWYYDDTAWKELGQMSILVDEDGDTSIEALDQFGQSDRINIDLNDTLAVDLRLSGTALKIGTLPQLASPSVYIGGFAGQQDETSRGNIGIGSEVLRYVDDSNASSNNTGVGDLALSRLGTAAGGVNMSFNTAVGKLSGRALLDGSGNAFFGSNSGSGLTDGSNNVAVGSNAGSLYFIGGDDNVVIGSYSFAAGYEDYTQSGAVKIGHNAGYADTTDNVLHISNTSSKSLIYGDFTNDYLQVGGELNINDEYSLPTTDGTANQVLATDGTGQVSWQEDESGAYEIVNGVVRSTGTLATDDYVFGRDELPGSTAINERFMFFDKSHGAFRAGSTGNQVNAATTAWSIANVGVNSAAFGLGNVASGVQAFATGTDNEVSGANALAFGIDNTVTGSSSIAGGRFSEASGLYSMAMGNNCRALADRSIAFGRNSLAQGSQSIAVGENCTASDVGAFAGGNNSLASGGFAFSYGLSNSVSGERSAALGESNTVLSTGAFASCSDNTIIANYSFAAGLRGNLQGNSSAALGLELLTRVSSSTVVGRYNYENATPQPGTTSIVGSNRIFVVGNGSSTSSRSNAFAVQYDGKVSVGTHTSTVLDHTLNVGNANDASVGIGSIEYIKDIGGNMLETNASMHTSVNLVRDIGTSTNAWDDIYADDFNNISDMRVKEDVQDLEYGLAEILNLSTIDYILTYDPDRERKLGLSAQELLTLIPEVVKTHETIYDEEGSMATKELDTYAVNYIELVPVLIKAIQEQQATIEVLRTEKQRLATVENELDLIKQQLQQFAGEKK